MGNRIHPTITEEVVADSILNVNQTTAGLREEGCHVGTTKVVCL